MGTLCAKTLQPSGPSSGGASSTVIETEKEVSIQNYSSQADKEFSKLETKDNLLREILFNEYMYSLVIFSVTNATLQDDTQRSLPNFQVMIKMIRTTEAINQRTNSERCMLLLLVFFIV